MLFLFYNKHVTCSIKFYSFKVFLKKLHLCDPLIALKKGSNETLHVKIYSTYKLHFSSQVNTPFFNSSKKKRLSKLPYTYPRSTTLSARDAKKTLLLLRNNCTHN